MGNICRSPLAEGILRSKVKEQGLDWYVDSAGTGKWHLGSAPDRRSIDIAKKHGIDISDQRARSVRSSDYEEFDLIFAMDIQNLRDLKGWALDKIEEGKISLIMDEVYPGENTSVPDPYFNDDGFEIVYQMLHTACTKIIEKYR